MITDSGHPSEGQLDHPIVLQDAVTPHLVRGLPAIGDPGRAAGEVQAGRPFLTAGAPDHSLSEFNVDGLEIRAASVRGLMHRHRGQPRQDEFSVTYNPGQGAVLVVVCDGVGSLPESYTAALLATRDLPALYWSSRNLVKAIRQVNENVKREDRGQGVAAARLPEEPTTADGPTAEPDGPPADDAPAQADEKAHPATMATTLTALALTRNAHGFDAELVWIGDSPAWSLSRVGKWSQLTTTAAAENEAAVHTGSTSAIPSFSVSPRRRTFTVDSGAIFLMTDGVGFSLEHAPEARAILTAWWTSPPYLFDFGKQVSFARKTQIDDRTVVGLWLG